MSEIKINSSISKPDYTEILSNPNFHMGGWIWAHSTIYRLFDLMEKRINSWQPKSTDDIQLVIKAIRAAFEFLNQHHDHEDQLVFPTLKNISQDIKEKLEELDKQHHEWHKFQGELCNLFDQLLQIKSVDDQQADVTSILGEIQKKFQETKECVFIHFADEERLLLPVVIAMPKKEQDKILKVIEAELKKEKNSKFNLCCMYDNTRYDKAVAKDFNKTVPWLVRSFVVPKLFMKKEYNWFINALEC